MYLKRHFLFSIAISGIIALFSQCSPRYGAHFQSTPTNNYSPVSKKDLTENNVSQPFKVEPFRSLDNVISKIQPIAIVSAPMAPGLEQSLPPVEVINPIALRSKKELKAAKKELKRDLKHQNKKISNQKIWIGVVIGVAGILVSILASGSVGAIAIIVGIGFIAWGLIEQGGV